MPITESKNVIMLFRDWGGSKYIYKKMLTERVESTCLPEWEIWNLWGLMFLFFNKYCKVLNAIPV